MKNATSYLNILSSSLLDRGKQVGGGCWGSPSMGEIFRAPSLVMKPSFQMQVFLSRTQILASYNLCFCTGAVRMHSGSLQHLVWLGLQWNSMSALFPLRKVLKQLFHLPQETSRLETDAPESICLLDLEVSKLSQFFNAFKCKVLGT